MLYLLVLLPALAARAQKVETNVGGNWVEIPACQTQSELRPGWKIVDYQMKSRLTRYLSGGRATQLADDSRPVFRITLADKEVLTDYCIIRLKAFKDYRKMVRPLPIENNYTRLELSTFDIKADSEAFICQPRHWLKAGEYILVSLKSRPIGELGDLMVYPFSVWKE